MADTGTFLTPREIAELTGVTRGKGSFNREQRQVQALAKMRIPHYVNPAGYPKVVRVVIEGGRPAAKPVPSWQPSLVG
jgi:hypothetical protein